MRYWICDISNPASESRFEIDFDEPPAEGSVIAPGRMVYKVTAVVRLASETSPGIIEVHRMAESSRIPAVGWPSYRPGRGARPRGRGSGHPE
jgi:hypothetical protein